MIDRPAIIGGLIGLMLGVVILNRLFRGLTFYRWVWRHKMGRK